MNKIKKEILETLLAYNEYDDFYSFIDVVIALNENGVTKEMLIEILNKILNKLDERKFIQDTIVGDTLDYITGWEKPQKNEKEYKLFIHFNSDLKLN